MGGLGGVRHAHPGRLWPPGLVRGPVGGGPSAPAECGLRWGDCARAVGTPAVLSPMDLPDISPSLLPGEAH